jgi:transposase
MMGMKTRAFTPVPAVSLDELVPTEHFYRHLEQVLDLTFVRNLVRECYVAGMGRPSIDPVVFFRLQLVMFFEGIRSERQLLLLAADRLSVRWYLGYNLDEPLPDHSSLTRIRLRYGLEVFRRFFDTVVEQCQHAGLVWGRELYCDATQVQADAALDSLTARFAVEARAALQAHLAALFHEETDLPVPAATADQESPGALPTRVPPALPAPLSVVLSDAEREDLAATNAARHDWIAEEGRQQREVHGIRQRTADVRISTTDPDATPMRLKGGGTHLGYQTHYVVDGGKARIIVGVLVTPGEVSESQPMRDLLWRTRFRWKLRVHQVTGDTKYGTTENIRAVEDMGMRAYMPLPDWDKNSPYFGTSRFRYDAEHDSYVCPNGQVLRRAYISEAEQRIQYRAQASSCRACPLKAACTPSAKMGRSVLRSFGEEYLERVQAYQSTAAY